MTTMDKRKLEAFIAAHNLKNISVAQCQEIAKELDFDGMTFDLVGPKGSRKCKWLDAYFGFFSIEGIEGFVTADTFRFAQDVHCENLGATLADAVRP